MSDGSTTQQEKLDKVDALINDIGIGMFTTTDVDTGHLYSRPMAQQGGLDDGSLYFFTYQDSSKVDEFQDDRQVNVAFGCPKDSKFVSVAGIASLVQDRSLMEKKWDESLRAWFAEGLDTKGITLIRVKASERSTGTARTS